MNQLASIDPRYSLSGFAVGLLVGQTGVGGGSLMTPLLVLLFGIHPATAVGTDLLYAGLTKSVGTLVHGLNRTVDWRVVGRLASGSVPATLLTLAVISRVDLTSSGVSQLISSVLGILLILTAASLVFRSRIVALAERLTPARQPSRTPALTVLTGAILGGLVTVSSIGAGALGVTALILLYPRLPAAKIVGSDIAHAVPLTLIAGMGHLWLGSVDLMLLASLLLGSVPGIMIGSYFSARMPDVVLRMLLAAVLILVGGRLVF